MRREMGPNTWWYRWSLLCWGGASEWSVVVRRFRGSWAEMRRDAQADSGQAKPVQRCFEIKIKVESASPRLGEQRAAKTLPVRFAYPSFSARDDRRR